MEDGFTKLGNTFTDKILSGISGSATKIFLIILRKTVGFHKESEIISNSLFQKYSGLSENSVSKSIRELKDKNIINYQKEGQGLNARIRYRLMNQSVLNIMSDLNKDTSNFEVLQDEKYSKICDTSGKSTSKFEDIKRYINKKKQASGIELNTKIYFVLKKYGLSDYQINTKIINQYSEKYLIKKIPVLKIVNN